MPAFLEAGSLFSASLFEENVVNLFLDYIGSRSCFQPRFMDSGVNLSWLYRAKILFSASLYG
jgi:hypothetical protein